CRTAEIADDEHVAPAPAVDEDAGRQRQEHERQELDRAERRHFERTRMECDERYPRDRELRDLRAELADRLAGPELQEVAMTPQATRRAMEPTHRRCAGRT